MTSLSRPYVRMRCGAGPARTGLRRGFALLDAPRDELARGEDVLHLRRPGIDGVVALVAARIGLVLRRAIELLDLVRIPAPERRLYPHQPRAGCGNA